MSTSEFAAIIFDSDGVLVDSETIHLAAELEYLAELGLSYDPKIYVERFMGLGRNAYIEMLASDYASEKLGPFPSDFDAQLSARVWPRIEAELQPVPGVAQLVTQFAGPVAVGSSARLPKLRRKLDIAGLFEIFDPHIYSADQVANGKPAPDLFLFAANKLGVDPARCLVIEDSENGVKAGVAAGMTVFGFIGGGHVDEEHGKRLASAGARDVFGSHAQIAALF